MVNGEHVEIVKRADGYMDVAVPAGAYELELNYAVTGLDWLARVLFVLAVAMTGMLIAGRPRAAIDRLRSLSGSAPIPSPESAR